MKSAGGCLLYCAARVTRPMQEDAFRYWDLGRVSIRLQPTPTIYSVCRQTAGKGARVDIDAPRRDDSPFPASLPEYQRRFSDDTVCAADLEKARRGNLFVRPYCHEARIRLRFTKPSALLEISPLRPTPSYTQKDGCILDIVGVSDFRTGAGGTNSVGSTAEQTRPAAGH